MTGSGPDRHPAPQAGGPSPLRFAGLGIQLAVSVLVLMLVGQWVDKKVGTDGVFAVIGAFVGFAGTMVSLARQLGARKGGPS